MHPPPQIDVQNADERVPARRVVVPADGGEEFRNRDVGADDGIQDPFEAQVGGVFQAGAEGVDAADEDGRVRRQAFARQETEECGFAGTVGCGNVSV
jgi:hypothetical protein